MGWFDDIGEFNGYVHVVCRSCVFHRRSKMSASPPTRIAHCALLFCFVLRTRRRLPTLILMMLLYNRTVHANDWRHSSRQLPCHRRTIHNDNADIENKLYCYFNFDGSLGMHDWIRSAATKMNPFSMEKNLREILYIDCGRKGQENPIFFGISISLFLRRQEQQVPNYNSTHTGNQLMTSKSNYMRPYNFFLNERRLRFAFRFVRSLRWRTINLHLNSGTHGLAQYYCASTLAMATVAAARKDERKI